MIRYSRFYNNGNIATLKSSKGAVAIFRSQDAIFAEQLTDSAIGVKLLHTNNYKSVIHTKNGDDHELFSYTPYGHCQAIVLSNTASGFNGEYPDPVTGNYMLGNGYRAFSPLLRRFICADSASPFGRGGLNAYAYCLCDPINNIDPDGHWTFNPAKITRHLIRSFKGNQAEYFKKKLNDSTDKVDAALKDAKRILDASYEKAQTFKNNAKPYFDLDDNYNLNNHANTTGTKITKALSNAKENIQNAGHYDKKITHHDSNQLAGIGRRVKLDMLQQDIDKLSARTKHLTDYAARIRKKN